MSTLLGVLDILKKRVYLSPKKDLEKRSDIDVDLISTDFTITLKT